MNITAIGTHLKVKNFNDSLKFYETLGFKKVFEYGPDKEIKETYNGAVFEHNNCKLEIADGHRAVKAEVFTEKISSSKISLMIYVTDLQEIFLKCKKEDIEIAVTPRHFYWNTLEMVVKDPDGAVIVFIAPYTKAAATRLNADKTFSENPN